ncbi:MAG: DMT family transporter [Candidatus Buchananbacteria bacterium]
MKKGFYLVLITAIISGLANFFNKFAMSVVGKDSFQYTTLKNILVALVLSLVILSPWIFRKLKLLEIKDWLNLALIGLIGGSIPFLLFFKGLSLTSSTSASFIHKTLFVWVAILAWPFLKEKVSWWQFVALGVLLYGNMVFEGFKGLSWGLAETLILLATLFWATETVIVKKTLFKLDSLVVAWGRMFFGAWFLLGFLWLTNDLSGLTNLNSVQWSWLLLASILLTAYVITWYRGLKMMPATLTACILVLASPVTTILNSVFVTHKLLAVEKFMGLIIILGGVACILIFEKKFLVKKIIQEN